MSANRWVRSGVILFSLFFLLSILEIDAWARVGGGGSFGSRGSRSFSVPRSTPAPTPSSPSQRSGQFSNPAAPAPSPLGGGGFLRGMAGGLMGGILGGMLFRSLGFAGGADAAGGGMGLMDIALIGALLYGIYWFIKRRRSEAPAAGTAYRDSLAGGAGQTASPVPMAAYEPERGESDVETGLRHIRQMDPRFDEKSFTDGCMDQFFQIQGAWAARDMSGVRNLLTDEMNKLLQGEADRLRAAGQINRLENIAVRSVEIAEIWQEKGEDFITVQIYANLLDYTTDERTGQIVSGSRMEPVKFREYWTFTRPVGDHPWKLSAIHQTE
ncbi:MAG: Tim44 domain-containing protein [Deltaproteobacteria bacterium]|nr:Tim44 domain-containing protein [Deltaproteobacteria bacterium]